MSEKGNLIFSTSYVRLHRRFYEPSNPFGTWVSGYGNSRGREQGCEIPPSVITPPLQGNTRYSSHIQTASSMSHLGRNGDPRMNRAVAVKIANPNITLLDALLAGGFKFTTLGNLGLSDRTIRDTNGTILYQRKNQLSRRIRLTKKAGRKSNPHTISLLPNTQRAQVLNERNAGETSTREQIAYQFPGKDISEADAKIIPTRIKITRQDSFDDLLCELPEFSDTEFLENGHILTDKAINKFFNSEEWDEWSLDLKDLQIIWPWCAKLRIRGLSRLEVCRRQVLYLMT